MPTPCYCGYHHDDESEYDESEYDESEYDSDYNAYEVSLGNIQVDLSSYMDIGPNYSVSDAYCGLPNDYNYADWRMNITMVHMELVM